MKRSLGRFNQRLFENFPAATRALRRILENVIRRCGIGAGEKLRKAARAISPFPQEPENDFMYRP